MSSANLSSTKIFVSIALMSAMISAATTYFMHHQATTAVAVSPAPSHVVQPTRVSNDDALAESPSWVRLPSLTDF